jgi:hypothetical protein
MKNEDDIVEALNRLCVHITGQTVLLLMVLMGIFAALLVIDVHIVGLR